QAALVGVLYLENNLARGVFTPARIELLTLVATQAVLSLENARLYSELQQDERELRIVVDFVPQHLVAFDPRGPVLYANRTALEFTGLSLDETTAHTDVWREIVHPDDLPTLRARYAEGIAFEVELRMRRRGGEYRWIFVRYAPLRDDDGRVVRWYA